ncbi:MAG: isopenicillin N synthase-like dioxygenase [Bacillariaceae sp.]|jgi:isopenicillin N synthase-like dioxygenase
MLEKNNQGIARLVIVDYKDLSSTGTNIQKEIEMAFGKEGVGIIGIQNVPGFVDAKRNLLSLSHSLAHLPQKELNDLEDPETLWNSGWSHGKEKLKNDTPDINKASYYYNPIIDVPGTEEERKKFPLSYPCNRWPKKESLPTFEQACKHFGSMMKTVAVELCSHIDQYAHSVNKSYPPQSLYKTLANTEKVKGRLLYYYPLPGEDRKEATPTATEDSWIGWHNDSGFLTCLSGGLWMEPNGRILPNPPSNTAGLYVVDRKDQVLQVKLPMDCMGIQIGECTQIITGGAVIATPHCVRGSPNFARTSLACFIDTPPTYRLTTPPGQSSTNLACTSRSSRVPSLSKRYTHNMLFGDFLEKTFNMYYNFDDSSILREDSNKAEN